MAETKANSRMAILLAAAILVALAVGIALWLYGGEEPTPPPQEESQAPAEQSQASAEQPQTATPSGSESQAESASASPPRFGLLSVGGDGSILVTGLAPGAEKIELLSSGAALGASKPEPEGDFVIDSAEPLSSGVHVLRLRSTTPDGRILLSRESESVEIPERKIAQAEAPQAEAPQEADLAEAPSGTEAEPADPEPEPSPEPEPEPVVQVSIIAAEAEGDRLFVSGEGEPGRTVRLRLDGELIGSRRVGEQGGFFLSRNFPLEPGEYELRAEQISPDGRSVENVDIARLIHDPEAPASASAASGADASGAGVSGAGVSGAGVSGAGVSGGQAQAQADAESSVKVFRTGRFVIIRRGDNLWTISRRMLGKGIRYKSIYEINSDQIENPDLIYPGQLFDVPPRPEDEEENQ